MLDTISCAGITGQIEIANTNIKDLEGLQYFEALSYVTIKNNSNLIRIPSLQPLRICTQLKIIFNSSLTTIQAPLPDELYLIEAGYMSATVLPDLPPRLSSVKVYNMPLITLPTLPSLFLQELVVSSTNITSLPQLPSTLKYLTCTGNNNIVALPTLPSLLTFLDCSQNRLTSLPSLPTGIITLKCYYNQLTSLPLLPASLGMLQTSNNRLSGLPSLPGSLYHLDCGTNPLGHLPDLPGGLTYLACPGNSLTGLPELPATLGVLRCNGNDIKCFPFLPIGLRELTFDPADVSCLPNKPSSCWINGLSSSQSSSIAICNATNNANQCRSFPIIKGNVFFDNNQNGVKDMDEPAKANMKLNLTGGYFTYTDVNGKFEISTDTLGTYTITPTAPLYYNVVPATAIYNFNTYDTLVSKDYALQANSIKDSLAIKLTTLNWAARPGFSFPYLISYENAGTTTLSPNVIFNYDNTKLLYDSSSNAAVINNGSNLSLNIGSFVPGQQENFIAYFRVKPTIAIGDSLFAKATISDNSIITADSSKVFLRGSFDPNDKQATPELSPLQVANGTYIDYTIRFQNTGNDTAFNVVISDTLASELLANTLKVVNTSHSCKTTVKGNVVFFEFFNILLPDSNVNEIKSHGFVSFRIQPHPSVPSGATINNKASIYFDYNAPVITNTASTFIKPFVVVPVKLISFSAVPQNDNTVSLYWNTANEINSKHFIIERGPDGLLFNSITSVAAKGMASNNYSVNVADNNNGIVFYRLKMVDNDGKFSYSPIIKIDRRKNAAGFSVLTNPVKDILIINTTDRLLNNTSANIINTQGAVVKSFNVKEGSQTINIRDLPSGIYYLRTFNGNSRFMIR